MSLEKPESAEEIFQRSAVDVQRELDQSDPFLEKSLIRSIIVANAERSFDWYGYLTQAELEALPDTANVNLERWAAIWGLSLLPASKASGNVAATGTPGSTIVLGTNYATTGGVIYTTTASATIQSVSLSVTSLTRSGSTVTATTASDHDLGSNISVTISGANETEYNGVQTITVNGLDTFTYEISGTPATPATGTILADFDLASVPVESDGFGQSQNQDLDTQLRLQSPIAGVDDVANVDFGEIGGGTDQETRQSLRERLLERIQNPVAHFNVAEITTVAKSVPGVTRVFVEEVTPEIGEVTIYFMRDNDVDPIPSASEVATVKEAIDEIRPANTSTLDVIVSAPTEVSTDFTFSTLTPDTSTMRDAITANLRQFFDERTSVGENIQSEAYTSAIFNTIDTETGEQVSEFTLSAPTGDITIASGEIGTLGTVTYP
jgi:uncharacterized phage protein gp47/JayE